MVPGGPTGPAVWGPVLHFDPATERLLLFFARSEPGSHHSVGGSLACVVSTDRGSSWSSQTTIYPRRNQSKVTANTLAVVPLGPNRTRWLLPFWYEGDPPAGAAAVLASDDGGDSWEPHGFVHGSSSHRHPNDTKLIENTLAPLPDGQGVLQLFRAGKGTLYSSISDDRHGLRWTKSATPTTLPNPSAKACMFARDDTGALVLAYNDDTQLRSPLSLAQSKSGAVGDFVKFAQLENDSSKSFAYPTAIQVGKLVHTVYSVYDPHSTAPHTHHWWGIRMATVQLPE